MKQEENKHKTSSTGKVKYGRETNTTINRNLVTYNVEYPRSKFVLLKNSGKTMTIIKFLVGAIEPCLFVAYYLTMFPTAVSSVDPTFQMHIFLHSMESIRTISSKDIW